MLEHEDTIVVCLPPGDDVIESLQESSELFPDCSSHFHLTHQLDIISLVVISHLGENIVNIQISFASQNTYDDIAAVGNEISGLCHSELLDLRREGLVVAKIRDLQQILGFNAK